MTAGIKKLIPFFLTFARVAATPVFVYLLACGDHLRAFIVFLFLCLTDLFDGIAARALDACTRLGAYLDVFADLMYVISSLIVLNAAGIAPIWFTFVVAFKFLEFAATNTVLKKAQRKGGIWIFDGFGRCFALLAFLSPGAFCLAELIPGAKHVVYFMVISVCIFAAVSMTLRIARCIRCRETRFSLKSILHRRANIRQHQ